MITYTIRDFTPDEKKQQLKKLPGIYKRFEKFVFKLIFIVGGLLIPLLTYDHFIPVPPNVQAVFCIVIVLAALLIAFLITEKCEGGLSNNKQIAAINTGQVEVVKVQTGRAVKRNDFDDFGIAFYIDVVDRGQRKTLFLWGQYLDMLEYDGVFPNTEFEFIRKPGSEGFIDFKISGQYFKEERVLPAFDREIWKKGVYPVNGQLLDQTIDTIT